MPTVGVAVILLLGGGLAFLIRSVSSLSDAIDLDNDVIVRDYVDRGQAQRVVDALKAKSITSMIRSRGYGRGIHCVVVRPDKAAQARQILASDHDRDEATS